MKMMPTPKFGLNEELQVIGDHRYLGRVYENTPLQRGVVARVTQIDANEFNDKNGDPVVVYTMLGHYIDEDCLEIPADLAKDVEAVIRSLTGRPTIHDCPHCTCGTKEV